VHYGNTKNWTGCRNWAVQASQRSAKRQARLGSRNDQSASETAGQEEALALGEVMGLRIVIPVVVGLSPISHPKEFSSKNKGLHAFGL